MDLKALVDKLAAEGAKVKSQPKAKPQPKPRTEVKPINSSKWQMTAIVLEVYQITCRCGHQSQAPAEHPFLRRTHPIYGTHDQALMHSWHPNYYIGLPRITAVVPRQVSTCHECFSPQTYAPELAQTWLDLPGGYVRRHEPDLRKFKLDPEDYEV